jgi:hypothetical protein
MNTKHAKFRALLAAGDEVGTADCEMLSAFWDGSGMNSPRVGRLPVACVLRILGTTCPCWFPIRLPQSVRCMKYCELTVPMLVPHSSLSMLLFRPLQPHYFLSLFFAPYWVSAVSAILAIGLTACWCEFKLVATTAAYAGKGGGHC